MSDITLKETAPVWQRVEGRPKTISGAAQLKNSNRVPQRRSDSSNAIERDLPFVVGQVILSNFVENVESIIDFEPRLESWEILLSHG